MDISPFLEYKFTILVNFAEYSFQDSQRNWSMHVHTDFASQKSVDMFCQPSLKIKRQCKTVMKKLIINGIIAFYDYT